MKNICRHEYVKLRATLKNLATSVFFSNFNVFVSSRREINCT